MTPAARSHNCNGCQGGVAGDIQSAVKKDPAVETRIDELLSKMTLEEKIGQLIQPEIKFLTPEDIKQYHVGSVLNGGGSTPWQQ